MGFHRNIIYCVVLEADGADRESYATLQQAIKKHDGAKRSAGEVLSHVYTGRKRTYFYLRLDVC